MTVADHTSSPTASPARAAHPLRQVLLAGLAAIVVSCVAVAVVATVGAALIDAPEEFRPLLPQVYLVFVVLGVALATVAWEVISRTARHPGRVLRLLVPTVVLVSLLPDVGIGLSSAPGASWGGAVVLMVLHLVVAAAAVPVFRRMLPVPGF